MKPSVKYRVIYRHKDKYSISEMCKFFGVSRSGYYDFVARMEMPDKDLPIAEKIKECQRNVVKHMVTAEFTYGLKVKESTEIPRRY